MATEYGKRLKKARKDAGLTQAELCKKTGIAQSTISTAEREGQGSNDVLYALATGVDPLWLSTGEESGLSPAVGINAAPAASQQARPTLEQTIERLSEFLNDADKPTRKRAVDQLSYLVDAPQDHEQVAAMMQAAFKTKQSKAA